jgi:enamine deaminase RidA (YjgF/YER057c/UK114 family)
VLLVYPANPSPYSLPIETTEHPAPLKEKDMTVRDVVFPPGRHALYERNRYSPAIKSDGLLFVSGQVGSREDGSPEPDLRAQVRLAFTNLNAILNAAGCTFDDVIDVTVFMVDPQSTFEKAWEVVPEFWGEAPHPTITAVGVTWLYGFDFEIKVIAKLP